MKFAFPILTAKGEEFKDVKALTALINGEKSGHYLLGNHNKWHGGIHISDKSAPWCKDKYPVRAIADGKVVAFRMMEDYLISEFKGESLRYSNCFCLVQHEYCEMNPETKAKNEFTFYSLYMHLLPWQHYQNTEKLVLKKNWNARNSVPHANPDEDQKRVDAVLPCFALPKDTELEMDSGTSSQRGKVGGKEYDFIKVTIKSQLSSAQIKEGEKAGVLVSEGSSVWIANSPDAVTFIKPNLPSWLFDQIDAELLTNMAGRADPTPDNETGRLMAGSGSVSLPAGTKVQYDAHQLEFHWVGDKARKMARCKYVMPSVDGVPGSCGLAWVCVEDEYIKVNARAPSHLGELYVLSSPVAIAAGETIGYLGLVETPGSLIGGRKSKHQVHLEVFTQDPRLDDVLANKANTKGGATYAKVPAELVLYEKQKQDGKDQWVKTEGKSLEELIESPKLEKDDAKKEWVCVSSGKYVEKSQVELLSQHDWLKLGFKKVDGSGSDGYLDPDAPPTFFTDLVKSFDTDGNNELSSEEILAALQDSGNAEQLHKLIVKHPSEWYEKSSASSYLWLDKLMAKIGLPDFDQLVDHEKQRIDKLEWMQSATKLKLGKDIWHFYPIISFADVSHDDCVLMFHKISRIVLAHEGGFVDDPSDAGGATNMGIAWNTWIAYAEEDIGVKPTLDNLKKLTTEQAETIYYKRYWKPREFCKFENIKTALMIYDWSITSGGAIREVSRLINDKYSPVSISVSLNDELIFKINDIDDQNGLVSSIADIRKKYYRDLTVDSKTGLPNKNIKFLKGWINRVNDCLEVTI